MGDERRKIIAQKLFDLANIEAGVIVFGELAGRGEVRNGLIASGAIFFALLYSFGLYLLNKQNL